MFKTHGLRYKLLCYAFVAIFIPVALLVSFSLYAITKNTIRSNWLYLDRIIHLIQTDFLSSDKIFSDYIEELRNDEYIVTKMHVHTKYRNYLSSSTLEWDMVPLREYLKTFALKNNIESLALYELYSETYKLACSFGSNNYLPIEYKLSEVPQQEILSQYDQSLDSIIITTRGSVVTDERTVGLIVIQKMFDSNFFHSYSLKYGVDIVVGAGGKTVFSSLPKHELTEMRTDLESPNSHISLKSDQGQLAVSKENVSLENEKFIIKLTLINKEPVSISQGFRSNIRLIVLSMFSIIVSVSLLFIWGVKIINNIKSLYQGTEEVSSGNLDFRLPVSNGDELGKLSDNFNQMVAVIQEKNTNLENKNKELQIMNYYIDSVLQSLKVNTIVVDRDYQINLINQGAQGILNLKDSLTWKSLFTIDFFNDKRDFFRSRIDGVFGSHEYDYIPEIELDKEIVSLHLCPIIDEADEIFGVLIVIINNTERENLKRELLRSQEIATIGQVYAYLAHEINNPITVMLNHIDLLKGKRLNKEETHSFLNRIESETLRIHRLVRNLLQFIKDDQVESAPCELAGICEQILSVLEPMIHNKNIDLDLKNLDKEIRISGNLLMLKQLFLNIVKNAVESVETSGGRISISIEEDDSQAVIEITDNGRGIPPQDLEKIFEPFYTSKSTTNTGLGLSLCREIVTKHRGTINIQSEVGKGTSVILRFPVLKYEKK